jgi:hypothetical protein
MSSEHSDINIGAVFGFAAGLVAVTVSVYITIWLLFGYLSRHTSVEPAHFPMALGQENRLPPEPRLQTDPKEDLKELRERQEQLLKTYQWVDKSQGIVRIPIDDAMRLTIAKGLPARPAEDASK